jgi:preprotein translocase subunit SecG
MGILLGILTFVLILVSLFLILVVLAQKSSDAGMGSAIGGGAAEAAFGADTNNVLSKSTIYSSILFFVLAFALYLGRIYERTHANAASGALPTIAAPVAPAPTPVPATPAPTTGTAPSTGGAPTTGTAPAAATPAPAPAAAAPAAAGTAPTNSGSKP